MPGIGAVPKHCSNTVLELPPQVVRIDPSNVVALAGVKMHVVDVVLTAHANDWYS